VIAVSTLRGSPGRGYRIDAEAAAGGHLLAKRLTTSQERQDYDTQDFVSSTAAVRRLSPVECERLQGFPDGWTIPDPYADPGNPNPKPDGPRYAQMGNAVSVPVIEWLGRRIMEYGS